MEQDIDVLSDLHDLRGCLRDVVALSALPAIWSGYDAQQITESLADVLRALLRLEFIYVYVLRPGPDGPLEVACTEEGVHVEGLASLIGRALTPWRQGSGSLPSTSIAHPFGDGSVRIVTTPIGLGAEHGVVIAGAQRLDFATETDALLLSVGANQAAILFGRLQVERAERQRLEQEAQRAQQEALREAQTELAHVTRVTMMGEITASIAHEVNQPIAAAVTNANTCLRWLTRDPPDVEEARAAAARIVKDATRAADIISRTRLLFKKGTAQRELVDVNEVIQEMIVLMGSEAYRYSISIRTDLAEDLPKAMADRVQLQQVFMNLMLNSIDAMKGVNAARELTVQSQQTENGQLLISVSDTGVGLPPEQAEQIFKAFFTTKPHGTGMGLPISRSIIESHGGRLWAAANAGPGTTFHFTLPAKVEGQE